MTDTGSLAIRRREAYTILRTRDYEIFGLKPEAASDSGRTGA